ncbi:MAG: hypothetical protein HOP16_09750 [Acidobacteria bacterium]|nr:hypothetical protein [Acidobacteriota bacterium]
MSVTAIADHGFEVSDVTGQKVLSVSNVPDDVTVSDLVQGLVGRMRLPSNDAAGRPMSYHARLDREGRHLQGTERVRESLQPGDRLVLQPNVDAGSSRRSDGQV